MGKVINKILLELIQLIGAIVVNKDNQQSKHKYCDQKTYGKNYAPSRVLKELLLIDSLALGEPIKNNPRRSTTTVYKGKAPATTPREPR